MRVDQPAERNGTAERGPLVLLQQLGGRGRSGGKRVGQWGGRQEVRAAEKFSQTRQWEEQRWKWGGVGVYTVDAAHGAEDCEGPGKCTEI